MRAIAGPTCWLAMAALGVAAPAAGCRRSEQQPGGAGGAGGGGREAAAAPGESASVAPPASGSAAPSASSTFGPWVTCYGGFRPESTPLRDVTRLSLLCGPMHGMRPLSKPIEAELSAAAPSREHPFELKIGQCVRAFAVSSSTLTKLELSLIAPSGEVLSKVANDDRWPVLAPDRALCAAAAGEHRVRAQARAGAGSYALSLWILP